jgi:hypothetical protein
MANQLENAIAKIHSVGDELVLNQVYFFDDYHPDPETGIGDPTALCERLGIPYTEDIMVEYPANRTFSPISADDISALEKAVGATLPEDYKRLLATFGAFHLPGNGQICFFSPQTAISATRAYGGYDNTLSMPVLEISPCLPNGDDIGFIRHDDKFGPELALFKHDTREGNPPDKWATVMANSLSEFIVGYLDGEIDPFDF